MAVGIVVWEGLLSYLGDGWTAIRIVGLEGVWVASHDRGPGTLGQCWRPLLWAKKSSFR